MPTYTRDGLRHFLDASGKVPPEKYRAYLARRKVGGPREMFPTREYAVEWLRLASVVKYVDGGWLGSVSNVATGVGAGGNGEGGRLERRIGKIAWQVISEEFGDGDLEKNHIYLWKQLARELHLGSDTNKEPDAGHVRGFDGLRPDQGSPRCWAAAVAQQCIGLLAGSGDFFPEALGFNMAYECLPYYLLVTSIELRELKLNDYYFAIHITIDNADMGHSAMARIAVERYIEGVRIRDGEEAAQTVWRRVQSGFILAEGLPTTPSSPVAFEQVKRRGVAVWQPAPPSTTIAGPSADERSMVDILMRKAPAADGLHCPSRIMIEGHTIEHWLDPKTINPERALRFLRGLSTKKPWVRAGDAEGSKLVKLVQWEGKMFGAFSKNEVKVLKTWIRSLKPEVKSEQGSYGQFVGVHAGMGRPRSEVVGQTASALDSIDRKSLIGARARNDLPSDSTFPWAGLVQQWISRLPTDIMDIRPSQLEDLRRDQLDSMPSIKLVPLLPLWFVSTSLLEQFPLSTSRLATPLGMTVIRILRSQMGFDALHQPEDVCAGLDDTGYEAVGQEMTGLWELGEKLCGKLGVDVPRHLVDVVEMISDEEVGHLCQDMMELRTRPYACKRVLLGMTLGAVDHVWGLEEIQVTVDKKQRAILNRIIQEIRGAIGERLERDMPVGSDWDEFLAGYERVRAVARA